MSGEFRFVFRADATVDTGAGHVKRCLTLATEFQARGYLVIFVGRIDIPWVVQELHNMHFDIFDADNYVNSFYDILILDIYNIDADAIFYTKNLFYRTIQIIDSVTPQMDADLYIHPGLNKSFSFPLDSEYKVISGINYLTTNTFRKVKKSSYSEMNIKSLLVIGGGTDVLDFTSNIFNYLYSIKPTGFEIHFMSEKLFHSKPQAPENFHFHRLGESLKNLMSEVDTVISTAGTSSWDFLANHRILGVALAVDNQLDNFVYQTEKRYALSISRYIPQKGWQISPLEINNLLFDNKIRSELFFNICSEFDTAGPARITERILKLKS